MSEKKSFWNWIGLPDSSDVQALQNLLQTQSETLMRMEEENQRLRNLLERSKCRIGQMENALVFRQKQAAERASQKILAQIQSSVKEIMRTLDATQTDIAAHMEKLSFADGKTYDAMMKNAQNQDELLRILIVNTLQEELETTLDASPTKKSHTSRGKSKRKV